MSAAAAAAAASSASSWLPAAISAGGSLLGGLISNRQNKASAESSADLQREFAQHGVSWKVADAKAAGLHPLYALGAQTSSASPVVISDSVGPAMAQAGQDISSAVMRSSAAPMEQEIQAATLEAAKAAAAKDFALAQAADAEAAKTRQDTIHSATGALYSPIIPEMGASLSDFRNVDFRNRSQAGGGRMDIPPNQVVEGKFQTQPSTRTSNRPGDPSMAAGPADVGWKEIELRAPGSHGQRMPMVIPQGSDLSDVFEEGFNWPIIRENVDRYGLGWLVTYVKGGVGDFPKHSATLDMADRQWNSFRRRPSTIR